MSTYSADYLRRLMVSVDKFSEAFEAWAETQVEATYMGARGIFPTAWTKEGQDPVEVAKLELEVAEKSGAASVATSVTGSYIVVQGMGALDPIANWSFMTAPKSPLTPRDVRMTVANVRGRLQAMLDDAEADTPGGLPAFSPALWHPVVWGAAAPQWVIHQYRVAVAEGAESLTHYWKTRLGRQDADASVFWQETLNASVGARPGRPKLVPPGDPAARTTRSLKAGLQDLGPALQQLAKGLNLAVRNVAAHERQELSEQDAMEMLSAYSMFARMLDQCEVEFADEGAEA